MKRIILVALVGVLVTSTAEATFKRGNDLFRECNAERETFSKGVCIGFIQAVVGGFVWNFKEGVFKDFVPKICLPKGATTAQLTDIVRKYLTDHPENRHYNAESLVILSVRNAFPCKK